MDEIVKRLMELRNCEDPRLNEMARVGFVGHKYEIYVRTNDKGNIPHFHMWDIETMGDKFHTCIKLTVPEYFHHEGKEGILSSKERRELVKFLESPRKKSRYPITNWEYLIDLWNDNNNSSMNVDPDQEMPDYNNLK